MTRIDYPLPNGWELYFSPHFDWTPENDYGDFVLRNTARSIDILLRSTPHDEWLFEQIRSYCGVA